MPSRTGSLSKLKIRTFTLRSPIFFRCGDRSYCRCEVQGGEHEICIIHFPFAAATQDSPTLVNSIENFRHQLTKIQSLFAIVCLFNPRATHPTN